MSRVTCISWTLTNSNNFHILWSCVQRLSPTSAFNFLWANLIFLLLSYLSITRKICLCPKLGQIADGMTLVKSLQRIFFFFFFYLCVNFGMHLIKFELARNDDQILSLVISSMLSLLLSWKYFEAEPFHVGHWFLFSAWWKKNQLHKHHHGQLINVREDYAHIQAYKKSTVV